MRNATGLVQSGSERTDQTTGRPSPSRTICNSRLALVIEAGSRPEPLDDGDDVTRNRREKRAEQPRENDHEKGIDRGWRQTESRGNESHEQKTHDQSKESKHTPPPLLYLDLQGIEPALHQVAGLCFVRRRFS